METITQYTNIDTSRNAEDPVTTGHQTTNALRAHFSPELEVLAQKLVAVNKTIVNNLAAIGRILVDAKKITKHGEFSGFLKYFGIGVRSAQDYMAIARSPLADQLAECGVKKALALASVPEDDAREILQQFDPNEMTLKELRTRLPAGASQNVKSEKPQEASGSCRGQTCDDGVIIFQFGRAIGMLRMSTEGMSIRSLPGIARERYEALVADGPDNDTADMLRDAVEVVKQIADSEVSAGRVAFLLAPCAAAE